MVAQSDNPNEQSHDRSRTKRILESITILYQYFWIVYCICTLLFVKLFIRLVYSVYTVGRICIFLTHPRTRNVIVTPEDALTLIRDYYYYYYYMSCALSPACVVIRSRVHGTDIHMHRRLHRSAHLSGSMRGVWFYARSVARFYVQPWPLNGLSSMHVIWKHVHHVVVLHIR